MPTRAEIYAEQLAKLKDGWLPQNYEQRMLIPEQRIAVVSDVHLPYHSDEFLGFVMAQCYEYGIEAIVFLGDLMDMHLYSSYGVTDYTTQLEREIEIAAGVVEKAASIVKTVYWSMGNHEERFVRQNKYMVGMKELANLCGLGDLLHSGQLKVSDNPALNAADGSWMLVHPHQYGRTPLVVPGKLATRFQQNVMSAHAHHFGQGFDETGKWRVIETGGCFEPSLHRYIQHSVTAHRQWVKGAWLLLDGIPVGLTEDDMRRYNLRGAA